MLFLGGGEFTTTGAAILHLFFSYRAYIVIIQDRIVRAGCQARKDISGFLAVCGKTTQKRRKQ